MKKMISLILAFAMIFSLAMPAMAADTTKTIYFKNSAGWSKINAYYWTAGNDQGGPQPWPGASLTHVADDVYSIEIPAEYDMVVFNNGSIVTGDLSIPTDGRTMYEYGPNEWSTYTPAPKTQSDVTAYYTPSTPAPAVITSVSITVDGQEYTSGNVTITPNSTVELTVYGTNLKNVTGNNFVCYARNKGAALNSGWFVISENGTSATYTFYTGEFKDSSNIEIVYYNDYWGAMTPHSTGIYVTYDDGTVVPELPNPLYFKAQGAAEVYVLFYDAEGEHLKSDQMTAVAGEEGIFSIDTSDFSIDTSDFSGVSAVEFISDVGDAEIMEIPTDGRNMYDYDAGEWTTYTPSTPDPVAKITGAIVYVNDVEQSEGNVIITAGDTVKVIFHGENLDYLTTYYAFRVGSKDVRVDALEVVIRDNTAIVSFAASVLSKSNNSSVAYVNAGEDMTKTGYTLTYLEKGTDLTTIYFKNTAGWETPHILFYDSRGNRLETAKLTLVGGESDIYSAEVPENKWIYQVDFYDNATATYAERQTIPTDGSNQYNYDGDTWTTFTPTVHVATSADIAWGSMAFTFTDGTNGAENGTWAADIAEQAGQVTVTNTGTIAFTATPSFVDKEDDYGIFSGSFDVTEKTLAANERQTFTMSLSGAPTKAIPAGTKIGSVTITIEEKASENFTLKYNQPYTGSFIDGGESYTYTLYLRENGIYELYSGSWCVEGGEGSGLSWYLEGNVIYADNGESSSPWLTISDGGNTLTCYMGAFRLAE